MPIPDFQTMMRPVLVAIEGDEPQSTAQIRDMVATVLNISDEERLVMLPSGKQALFTNRVAWAIKSATLTLDRYGHLYPDELQGVADRLDSLHAAAADFSKCAQSVPTRLQVVR